MRLARTPWRAREPKRTNLFLLVPQEGFEPPTHALRMLGLAVISEKGLKTLWEVGACDWCASAKAAHGPGLPRQRPE
jgi:hypothetical protein